MKSNLHTYKLYIPVVNYIYTIMATSVIRVLGDRQVIPFGCGGHDLILMVFESTTTYAVSIYQQ
jgi:hypothetical protein